MSLPFPVVFVAPRLGEAPPSLDALAPALVAGDLEATWIAQTYLHLAARGERVLLAPRFPERDALCIHLSPIGVRWGGPRQGHGLLHALRGFPGLDHGRTGYRCFRVVVCPDRPTARTAHVTVFQNPAAAQALGGLDVPHWPQPGLVPRDAGRGDALENVFFVGVSYNLDPELRSPAFAAALAARGLRLHVREGPEWHDYRTCDVVLAVRSRTPHCMLLRKPASKLINAWRAGVPAILGREPAYAAVGEPERDFLVADDAPGALRALDRLRRDPGLARELRARGRARAKLFDVDAIATRWSELLAGPIAERYVEWRARRRVPSDAARFALAALHEGREVRRFWTQYERERRAS